MANATANAGPERTAAPSAVNLFNLLVQRPALLDQLVRILVLAPTLADELGRRPELLDALIDRRALDLPGSVADIAARMKRGEDRSDYEHRLDRVRRITGELRFALGLQGPRDDRARGDHLALDDDYVLRADVHDGQGRSGAEAHQAAGNGNGGHALASQKASSNSGP